MKALKGLFLLMMICSMTILLPVCAIDALTINLEGYIADNGTLNVFFNTNLERDVNKDELKLSLGNASIAISEMNRLAESQEGASYLFLVDVSGSMSDKKLSEVKEILTQIVHKTSDKDNISIFSVGNEAYSNPFVSTKEEYEAQIDSISRKSKEDTNLYTGIVKGLDVLLSSDKAYPKKCLVILSDGEDDYTTGITLDEVYRKIDKCHIPIFTVAMMENKPSARKVEASKTLGSLARRSPGGLDLVYGLDQTIALDLALKIQTSIENSYVIKADLSNYHSDGNEQVLKLDIIIPDHGKASDSYTIPTNGLGVKKEATPPSPTQETTDSPDNASGTEDDPGELTLIIVAAVLGILVLVVVSAILIARRRKGKKQTAVSLPEQPEAALQAEDSNTSAVMDKSVSEPAPLTNPGTEQVAPEPQEPDVTVVLTKMDMVNNQVYMVDIYGSIIIGRSTQKAGLAFQEDKKLSAAHCSLRFSSNKLYIADLNSTNGTYVNGVPISQEYRLEKSDVISIGSMQFRINW